MSRYHLTNPGRVHRVLIRAWALWPTQLLVGLLLTGAISLASWEATPVRAAPARRGGAAGIKGVWKVACENSAGMQLKVVITSKDRAVTTIHVLGKARDFGYKKGQQIMRLKLGSGDTWTGQLLWRNSQGVQRWQPITVRLLQDGRLSGRSANENCYELMERVK